MSRTGNIEKTIVKIVQKISFCSTESGPLLYTASKKSLKITAQLEK
jgi:hypothetical protein